MTSSADRRAPLGGPVPELPAGAGPLVALAGAEFGWGSGGKLSAVLTALAERAPGPVRFIGLGSGLGRPLLAGHPVDDWYDLPRSAGHRAEVIREIARDRGVAAALVVLDGPLAMSLEEAGVPTVFVDSLPFLWTEGDRAALPLDVSVYCAQRCPELPHECRGVLASVRQLRWVGAVVGVPAARAPRPAAARPYRTALVSLGGLRAPRLGDWSAYPRLVVPPVLEALAAHGITEAHLAGNLTSQLAARLTEGPDPALRVTSGPLGHGAFLDRLADCDVLLTSPGLTTLLEAGALGVPTVCLPPQNLSQILNGRFHSRAVGAAVRVPWPKDVLPEDDALALRERGEDHALETIYRSIASAAAEPGIRGTRARLRAATGEALRTAAAHRSWDGLTEAVGTDGAAQVAHALLSLLPAQPRPSAPGTPR
ncbi:hydroxymethylcytosylglucuronate/cytosylglucuronate synthase [Streptomyces sp. LP05-1]|uniref:Hydroxymethylcytosylglucuronate/cytosylglucurona te synthase n=1 Tax=Streptomyces pyxinae TaxID=2970734 RepID=A0ABT2CBM3_9ACTN|nr:hydroxymethylcytosylglucuronate/cytosylglucuronate synthase [Streptomyces sp. LP05-1]MCS0634811.1 hydroxymethylcytosylglucuronate/cytosylglucuronate synthase [Streptomyces sp. LP05-1]